MIKKPLSDGGKGLGDPLTFGIFLVGHYQAAHASNVVDSNSNPSGWIIYSRKWLVFNTSMPGPTVTLTYHAANDTDCSANIPGFTGGVKMEVVVRTGLDAVRIRR